MIVQLETIGLSTELVAGVVQALAKHNEAWWRRERAQGRFDDGWLARVRYTRPSVQAVVRLRDAGTLLAAARGGCGELAAAYAGWAWAQDQPAQLETLRVDGATWHVRVIRPGEDSRIIWDPERMVRHG